VEGVMRGKYAESLSVLLGAEPSRPGPGDITVQAAEVHELKRMRKEDFERVKDDIREYRHRRVWRKRRWTVLITTNLLFVLSYWFDVQLLEGALTASRMLGFHLIDLNSALQVMLAHKHVIVNLLIGTATVAVLWLIVGGRSFCSWVCPYHLLAEIAEMLHLKLAAKKIVRDHAFHRGLRVVLWAVFALLAIATGYTVFETISPTGIVSRALIYGPGLALGWVLALLAFEVMYSRRAWCRYVCPIGLTYGLVGVFSPVRVTYRLDRCFHEGDCRKVCMVPHVLDHVIKGRAATMRVDVGADCTRCGMCVDECPSGALIFTVKGLSRSS
jgi:ferredoxin-type protein NapH